MSYPSWLMFESNDSWQDAPQQRFCFQRTVTTRKPHVCCVCRQEQPAGTRMDYVFDMTTEDDKPHSSYHCVRQCWDE